jgi:sugar (pentulose or hexulose) kinase
MSLVGIDVGSSAVKAAAYDEQGRLLGLAGHELTPLHPQPGWWEQDPTEVWQATTRCMQQLAALDAVRADPIQVIAVSASGREVFPVDANGMPLGNCLMGADVRGAEFEALPHGETAPEPWTLTCGHLRERMDPVFRLLWWRKEHPHIAAQARWFLGWHEFLNLHIGGQPITDHSMASRWLVYDLHARGWSHDRLAAYHIDPAQLPAIGEWGQCIGRIRPQIAAAWGLSPEVQLAVGGHDINCMALGVGARDGTACLASGSYENILVPANRLPTASMLMRGLSVMPHPGVARYSTLAVSPTGAAVLNWARDLLDVSIETLDAHMGANGLHPAALLAVPFLSGSMVYWDGGRKARGALIGLTLATSRTDIVQAFMESIAYDHVNTFGLLADEGVRVRRIRAAGGGTRSAWWTQLKSDMIGLPINVVDQPEPGTLGAAILAGCALGVYADMDDASTAISKPVRCHEPSPARAALHAEKLAQYRHTVKTLLHEIF